MPKETDHLEDSKEWDSWRDARGILRLRNKEERKRVRLYAVWGFLAALLLYFLPLNIGLGLLAFFIIYEGGAALERYLAIDRKLSKQGDRLQAYTGFSSYYDSGEAVDLVKSLDPGTDVTSQYFEKKLKLNPGASYDLVEWLHESGYLQSGENAGDLYYVAFSPEVTRKAMKTK